MIPNSFFGGIHSTNAVNLLASSTIDPNNSISELGALTWPRGTTLTVGRRAR